MAQAYRPAHHTPDLKSVVAIVARVFTNLRLRRLQLVVPVAVVPDTLAREAREAMLHTPQRHPCMRSCQLIQLDRQAKLQNTVRVSCGGRSG